MRDVFISRLLALAKSDPRYCLITGDLGFKVFDEFSEQCPDQFLNVGVAEQNMTGIATGMALEGRIVFTYSIANFPTLRCLEQIRNDAAYHDANVNVVAVGGGFSYGSLGMSHHATEDLSILRAIPELTVAAPGDLWETDEIVPALANTSGTTYLRLDKMSAGHTQRDGEVFELGRARQLLDGHDVTLIATGGVLGEALQAAELLREHKIDARVVSMHTVKPIDERAIVAAATETGGVFTIEEHTVDGGLGGAVAEACLEHGAAPRVFYRLGIRGGRCTVVGSQPYLRRLCGLDAPSIAARVQQELTRGSHSVPASASGNGKRAAGPRRLASNRPDRPLRTRAEPSH